jgi:hypothetical protein
MEKIEMKVFETHDEQRLELGDGTYLLLVERNTKLSLSGLTAEDYARNVWKMRNSGEKVWRIHSDRDHMGSPFIQLFVLDNPCLIDRWDSNIYKVDLETGWAEQYQSHK